MERIIQFQPAFEKKNSRGPARCWFCLKGPNGAITFSLSTGWYLPESEDFIRSLGHELSHGEGMAVATHATWPYADYLEDNPHEECEWLDGEKCYGDVGFLAGETFFEALVHEGEDALWALMQSWYDDLPEKPKEA